jgi:L-alanine-DL-glutamate epimerase-like enolase superfamily enzyme
MRVTDVTAVPVSVPVGKEYATSLSSAPGQDGSTHDHVVVHVETDRGVTGYGEAAPMAAWPHGLTQGAVTDLVNDDLAATVEGRAVHRIPRIVEDLERQLSGEPFPIYGIDVALHDALGRYRDRPVYDLLGGPKNEVRTFECHYSIGIEAADAMAADAVAAAERGFRAFKVKVGGDDHAAEVEGLVAIAEAVPEARIRVDANQGYRPDEAVRKVREIDEAVGGLVLIEQPVPYDDREGLKRVREAVRPAVLADEAVFSPRDVADLARRRACDVVNIKLAKTGGLHRGTDVATVAEAHGLTCFVGSMVELGIGTAASAHLAVSTPTVTYPTGVINAYTEDTLVENDDEWAATGATFAVPDRPGLGVDPDLDAIERLRVD